MVAVCVFSPSVFQTIPAASPPVTVKDLIFCALLVINFIELLETLSFTGYLIVCSCLIVEPSVVTPILNLIVEREFDSSDSTVLCSLSLS